MGELEGWHPHIPYWGTLQLHDEAGQVIITSHLSNECQSGDQQFHPSFQVLNRLIHHGALETIPK